MRSSCTSEQRGCSAALLSFVEILHSSSSIQDLPRGAERSRVLLCLVFALIVKAFARQSRTLGFDRESSIASDDPLVLIVIDNTQCYRQVYFPALSFHSELRKLSLAA